MQDILDKKSMYHDVAVTRDDLTIKRTKIFMTSIITKKKECELLKEK